MKSTALEIAMLDQIKNAGLTMPDLEVPTGFGKTRFDFAWPELMLALEVEGGTWANGRHSRGAGYARDAAKYNAAQVAGWMVIRVTSDMIRGKMAIDTVVSAYVAATNKKQWSTPQ